jgi:hypothetical protein
MFNFNICFKSFVYSKSKNHYYKLVAIMHILEEGMKIMLTIPPESTAREILNAVHGQKFNTVIPESAAIIAEKVMGVFLAHKTILSGYSPVPDQRNRFHKREEEESIMHRSSRNVVNPNKKILLLPGRLITATFCSEKKMQINAREFETICNDLMELGLGVFKNIKLGTSSKASKVFIKKKYSDDMPDKIEFLEKLTEQDITRKEYLDAFNKTNKNDHLIDENGNPAKKENTATGFASGSTSSSSSSYSNRSTDTEHSFNGFEIDGNSRRQNNSFVNSLGNSVPDQPITFSTPYFN